MRRRHERMRPRLSLIAIAFATAAIAGCVHRYVEPTPAEPHAIVKFRFLHHVTFSTTLGESLRIDGRDVPVPPGVVTEARLETVRVRPVLSAYHFRVEYSHTEIRQRVETATESYSCGTFNHPQTCTRLVTRTVYDNVHVTDAACDASMRHVPLAGAIYLVQYDFLGHDACSVSCYRQLPGVGAEFELVPCGPGEPPVEVGAGGEVLAPPPVHWPSSMDERSPAESTEPSITAPTEIVPPPTRPSTVEPPREEGASGLSSPRR